MRKLFFFLVLTAVFPNLVHANLSQYVHVRETLFWDKLYTEKYHTLYCAVHHEAGKEVDIAQVYPIDWMAAALNCPDVEDCDFARYKEATADLHNWWPMQPGYSDVRKHYLFVEKTDPEGKKNNCNMIIYPQGIEPREWAKGEIARSMLHMMWRYRLPHYGQIPLMVKWAKRYPASAEEKWRNDKIKQLQGIENRFIADPSFIDTAFPDPASY